MPEEVALGDAADVLAVVVQHRYGGVAIALHDLEPLTDGVVVV